MERWLVLYAQLHLDLFNRAMARNDLARADVCLERAEQAMAKLEELEKWSADGWGSDTLSLQIPTKR